MTDLSKNCECKRPALRYHGGKWILAPWIISHFPDHRVYVEPYGGAASTLIRKERSYAEIYNDLDGEIVSFFRVLQDAGSAARLIELLRLTPFARDEFEIAYEPTECPIERARRLAIRSFMGFGSDGHNGSRKTGFRANSNRSGSTPAGDWSNYPDGLQSIVDRFKRVTIENRPAIEVMLQHDSDEAIHYVDPPYMHSTRSKARNSTRKNYRHEMTDEDHELLLETLLSLAGMVVLSGYPNDTYDHALLGWQRVERDALADGARKRTEVLWLNKSCFQALNDGPLFAGQAYD